MRFSRCHVCNFLVCELRWLTMKLTIISCSLDPESRSRQLAVVSLAIVGEAGHHATFIDLRELGLPHFDNIAFNDPRYEMVHRAISTADGVVIASPVYNWGLSSMTKNLIEWTGATGEQDRRSAWFDKPVTFVCAGGLPIVTWGMVRSLYP